MGRGLPVWAWVVGPVLIVTATVVLLAVLRQADSDDPESGVTLRDVSEEPGRFYGETVTVNGQVQEVLGGSRSFLISKRFIAEDLLVVSSIPLREVGDQPGDAPLSEGDLVWVTGEVRKFDIASAEQKIGADLDNEALDPYVNNPAIIADSVSTERPE